MAGTETELVNLSLTLIGAELIEDIEEEGGAAATLRVAYASERDALLRAHPWRFAVRRAHLTTAAPANIPPFGFAYAYALPESCLRVLEIGDRASCDPPPAFAIEGEALLTDEEAPVPCRYIVRVDTPPSFDPHFFQALARRVAAAVAERFTGSTSKREALLQEARDIVREGRRLSAMENPPKPVPPRTEWLEARQ